MKLTIANRLPKSPTNACYVHFLFEDATFNALAKKLDSSHNGLLKRLYKTHDFTAKTGQSLMLHGLDDQSDTRHLLIGLGNRKSVNSQAWITACSAAASKLVKSPAKIALSDCLSCISIAKLKTPEMAEHLVKQIGMAGYRFQEHLSDNDNQEPQLKHLALHCSKESIKKVQASASQGLATANAMAVAQNLGNLAPNICTPTYLANQALSMATQFDNFNTQVLEEQDMKNMGMGAMLAVSAGSVQPAKLIVMNYQGKKRAGKPIVLIGKGVTFDTGGISIKPSNAMDEMKYDMCGAASVFGVMHALGTLQSAVNVVGIVAAAENMPDGKACRPGDVVSSMSGQTIEILNTDAEGRLVLCDALTYAQKFKPAAVIDIATLTGAAVVALGHHLSAVFGNDQATIDALVLAGNASNDPTWPMPMGDLYQKQLDSNFADMANIGGSPAGAITAACFLARFAKKFRWAHLDVAGVAWRGGAEKGATGRPVPLLLKYLMQQSKP